MKKILKEISEIAINLERFTFTQQQIKANWLGNPSALEDEIKHAENRLGITFPSDYKEFLLITNGFTAPNDIEPTFENVSKIDFLKNIDDFLIEVWSEGILIKTGKDLAKSILIGGLNDEQYFLLIPPSTDKENWKYWKFASWHPGERSFINLEAYFINVLNFMKDTIAKK